MPIRSPWQMSRLTFRNALTSMTGFLDRRNICPTRNSFKVTRECFRTRKVKLTSSSSIRAMSQSLVNLIQMRNGIALQMEDQLPLFALQGQCCEASRCGCDQE